MDLDTRSFMDALLCGVNSSLCRSVLHKALISNQQDKDAKCAWVRKIMAEFGWVDMATVGWSPLHSADRDGRKKFSLQLPSSFHSVGDLIFLVSITMPWPAPSNLQRLPFMDYVRRQTMEGLAAYNAAYAARPLKAEEEEREGKGSPNLATAEVEIGTEAVANDVEAEFSEEEEEEEGFVMEVQDDEYNDSDEDNDNDEDNAVFSDEDEEEMPPRPPTPTPLNSCPRNSSPSPWKCTNFVSNPRPSKMQCVSKK